MSNVILEFYVQKNISLTQGKWENQETRLILRTKIIKYLQDLQNCKYSVNQMHVKQSHLSPYGNVE